MIKKNKILTINIAASQTIPQKAPTASLELLIFFLFFKRLTMTRTTTTNQS